MSGVTLPASSAIAIGNGFMVEPGSNMSTTARLRRISGSSTARLFGLYDGVLASASTSPVRASSTTTPPAFALFTSIAAFSSR
ncbi:hypothetical protein D3C78_1101950 [compost metagenome]